MQTDDPLLYQFATSRPGEMADLLANRDLAELTELIASLPLRAATALATRLPSWQLTRLLATAEPALVAQMLTQADVDEAVALVAHLSELRYGAIIEAAPERERRSINTLLETATSGVASLAKPNFIRVPQDTLCGVFSEQLAASNDTRARLVLVVDNNGKYRGILSLQAVYSHKNRMRQVAEVTTAVDPLNGSTTAITALTARQWMKYAELPVVDARHRILGVVSRAALERVAGDATPREFNLERVISELATHYLNICARVLVAALGKSK